MIISIITYLYLNVNTANKKYGGTIPPFKETRRFVNIIMQDYKNQKMNPDPAIAKYTKKAAIDTESEINNSPKPIELPDLKEIPETREVDTIMEIL